jgi:predicted RNA polymerase sigma factor
VKALLVVTLAMVACCAAPKAAGPDAGNLEAELATIERELVQAGSVGSQVGHLFERRGDLLAGAGRTTEAIAAYGRAAQAYAQSPEATTMPVIDSERAHKKAEQLKTAR